MRTGVRWRSAAWITAAAAGLVAGLHLFSPRPGLSPADFVAGGPEALAFCDPDNPRPLAVVGRTSAVTMRVLGTVENPDHSVLVLLALGTASGRPIGPSDLLSPLRLFLVDSSLQEFVAISGVAGRDPGDWRFAFQPRRGGDYRLFADFTPAATRAELYASADVALSGAGSAAPPEAFGPAVTLSASPMPICARQPVELAVRAPFPAAHATLAIFDQARTQFMCLHSAAGLFRFSFSDPGRYVAWCRADVAGTERTASCRLLVQP